MAKKTSKAPIFTKAPPKYVLIKKSYNTEESYTINHSSLRAVELQTQLAAGHLNMIQSATIGCQVWVVNGMGECVAVLDKDGGCDSDVVEVEVR